jgi:hypothetical protein
MRVSDKKRLLCQSNLHTFTCIQLTQSKLRFAHYGLNQPQALFPVKINILFRLNALRNIVIVALLSIEFAMKDMVGC